MSFKTNSTDQRLFWLDTQPPFFIAAKSEADAKAKFGDHLIDHVHIEGLDVPAYIKDIEVKEITRFIV